MAPRKAAKKINDAVVGLDEGTVVGIDLGTTQSAVAAFNVDSYQVLGNNVGGRTTPSIVGFKGGKTYVGVAATQVLPVSQQVFDAKRLIGRQWKDLDVQKDRAMWPFEVVEQGGVPRIKVQVDGEDKLLTPEEISAMVLRDLKNTAEINLGQTVSKAVVTVPAYFNERQRQATKDACRIAGLEVLALLNEPTAAAIAYGLGKDPGASRTVLVYDLGGGTFDVSVVKIKDSSFRVLASGGDTHLGGQDFDEVLFQHCLKEFKNMCEEGEREVLLNDPWSAVTLRQTVERAKRILSVHEEAQVAWLPDNLATTFRATLTRATFEGLCEPLITRTLGLVKAVLKDAKLTAAKVDDVVLVGGSTRIPKVRAQLRDIFRGKELRQTINPDEAVAYGAAVHAASLAGDKAAATLIEVREVTPLSLGVAVEGEKFFRAVPRNTRIPCERMITLSTVEDNQIEIFTEVYQGELQEIEKNYYLNKGFKVAVPPLPRGKASVLVVFTIDSSGVLTVRCEHPDPTPGPPLELQITPQEAHLSEADIRAMYERANLPLPGEDGMLLRSQRRLKS